MDSPLLVCYFAILSKEKNGKGESGGWGGKRETYMYRHLTHSHA